MIVRSVAVPAENDDVSPYEVELVPDGAPCPYCQRIHKLVEPSIQVIADLPYGDHPVKLRVLLDIPIAAQPGITNILRSQLSARARPSVRQRWAATWYGGWATSRFASWPLGWA